MKPNPENNKVHNVQISFKQLGNGKRIEDAFSEMGMGNLLSNSLQFDSVSEAPKNMQLEH